MSDTENKDLNSPTKTETPMEVSKEEDKKEESAPSVVDSPPTSEPNTPTKSPDEPVKKNKKKSYRGYVEIEEDSDDEMPMGLLERPVVIETGTKRERKKTDRLPVGEGFTPGQKKKVDIPEGKGIKLGDCAIIEYQLQHLKAEELKVLHRLLFVRVGAIADIKKNIRQFNGFTFESGDKEYEKRVANLNKATIPQIKTMCRVLSLERNGTKKDLVTRLITFLLKPEDSGKSVPKPKLKRKRSSKKSKSKGDKEKKKKKPKKESKEKKSKEDVSEDEDDEDEDDENEDDDDDKKSKTEESADEESSQEDEESDDNDDKEEDEKPPKKKKQRTESPKTTPKPKKVKSTENGKKEKNTPKKTKKVIESDDDDEDDEPLKKSSDPPDNNELKKVIEKILDGADLEEVTMKTVVKQVYAKYPSFDLSDKKEFIKNTVKQIIS